MTSAHALRLVFSVIDVLIMNQIEFTSLKRLGLMRGNRGNLVLLSKKMAFLVTQN